TVESVNKSVGNTNKSMGSLGKTATSGLDKATGSAKKLNKELGKTASFDELYVLDQKNDSSSEGGGSGSNDLGGGAVDMSGLDFDWGSQTAGASKLNAKVEQLLGFTKSIGGFIDKYKVPIVSTIAAITAGLATLGIAGIILQVQSWLGATEGLL